MGRVQERPMRKNPKGENDFLPVRFMDAGIRSMEGEGNERRFELSFSSEEPYGRWFGSEILDHTEGCMDLERLNSIGVLLFNHDTDRVLGKVERAWNQDNRGVAVVEFDDDEAAETIRRRSWRERNPLTDGSQVPVILQKSGRRWRSASYPYRRIRRSVWEGILQVGTGPQALGWTFLNGWFG